MEEIIPAQQRKPWPKAFLYEIKTELKMQLPSYFDSYTALEHRFLYSNLCQYYHMNDHTFYRPINCSQILDGILTKSYPETVVMYQSVASEYMGLGWSKLLGMTRVGARYPVYMQICYPRHLISSILQYLHKNFIVMLKSYAQQEVDR